MLHHPFRDIEDPQLVGSSLGRFSRRHSPTANLNYNEDEPDHYDVPELPAPDDLPEDEPRVTDDGVRQAWIGIAGQLPQRDGTRV